LGQSLGDRQEAVPVGIGFDNGNKPFRRAYTFEIALDAIQVDAAPAGACAKRVRVGEPDS